MIEISGITKKFDEVLFEGLRHFLIDMINKMEDPILLNQLTWLLANICNKTELKKKLAHENSNFVETLIDILFNRETPSYLKGTTCWLYNIFIQTNIDLLSQVFT